MITPQTETCTLRSKALQDRLRPAYHFTSPAAWLNDPNGVAEIDGTFHLFYQYNPEGPFHGNIHWGHATSRDLMRWTDHPIALRPDTPADANGCWSGVLVKDGDRTALVYSGHSDASPTQTACVAFGDATLDHWTKAPQNPVIAGPPAGASVTAFRDHCVWRENGSWMQLIGSGIEGKGGCAFLYESDDLIAWRERGPLVVGDATAYAEGDPLWTGTMWECVDFFRFLPDGTSAAPDASSGHPHALIFSAWHEEVTWHPLIALGRYEDGTFVIERYQRLDLGGRHAYAPQTFADEAGRRVLWAWMQEARDDAAQQEAGWSGAMILPRSLHLDERGIIRQLPVGEATTLRGTQLVWDERDGFHETNATQAELGFGAGIPAGSAVEVSMFRSADGSEETVLRIARATDQTVTVSLNRSRSTADTTGVDVSEQAGVVPSEREELPVHILLDRSSIEVFVDGIALTTRVYPSDGATGVRVLPLSGAAASNVRGWELEGVEEQDRVIDSEEAKR